MENKADELEKKLKETIINVPDFPIKGIIFRDITPVLLSPELFQKCIDQMAEFIAKTNPTAIIAPEMRGCLFAAPIAYKLNLPLVVARKKDKLPRAVYTAEYKCEYSINYLQVHKDSFTKNDRIVIVDDVLATAGTALAVQDLVHQFQAQVISYVFLIELLDAHGRNNLQKDLPILSIVRY